ncbi:hypothetical protein GOP47_0010700 [Adiantum capillus-veneris]|uniref:Uncharacterized protein n=1 Tax=Adiantum capillus-veneris TaxID=13818 RepID=A0A9D4ZGM8_ADICA|nr:hypothetical protein GOP47_0010700 [Adiantum capillus-veneris]
MGRINKRLALLLHKPACSSMPKMAEIKGKNSTTCQGGFHLRHDKLKSCSCASVLPPLRCKYQRPSTRDIGQLLRRPAQASVTSIRKDND